MKRLTLIKQYSAVQVGHLYEHIFCMQLDNFFNERHLYPYIDYMLMGKTYYGGIIYINLELYSDSAIELADAVARLETSFSNASISVAIKQMVAEREVVYSSTGYDNVQRELQQIQEQSWQNIDTVGLVDAKDIHKKRGALYIDNYTQRVAKKLFVTISLDVKFARENRELIPLFRQLAWLIISSLQSVLPSSYGYYSFDDKYKNSKDALSLTNVFKVAYADDPNVDLDIVLHKCLEVVDGLRRHNAFKRFLQDLRDTSYYNRLNHAPNPERNYEDTHIFVGSQGWNRIARKHNGELLLDCMTIEVGLGRNKVLSNVVSDSRNGSTSKSS